VAAVAVVLQVDLVGAVALVALLAGQAPQDKDLLAAQVKAVDPSGLVAAAVQALLVLTVRPVATAVQALSHPLLVRAHSTLAAEVAAYSPAVAVLAVLAAAAEAAHLLLAQHPALQTQVVAVAVLD
jgi:hypothetical protein